MLYITVCLHFFKCKKKKKKDECSLMWLEGEHSGFGFEVDMFYLILANLFILFIETEFRILCQYNSQCFYTQK